MSVLGVGWDNEFAYLQARVRAKVSRLPGREEWATLGPLTEATHYLQRARVTRIASLMPEHSSTDDPHLFEGGLRSLLHSRILELLKWSPRCAADLIQSCALLPYLGLLEHARLGGESYVWLSADNDLKQVEKGLGGGLLVQARAQDRGVAVVWLELVRERLVALEAPASLYRAVHSLLSGHPLFEAEPMIEQRLYHILRLEQSSAAQIVAYAGLLHWLGMRLRGEVMQRLIFAGKGGAA